MTKVSVIVPVHNTEKYLRNCVESIQAQTLKDIEIILVENASTDGSLELCKHLADQDERISYIHSDIGDLAAARNLGLTKVKSEYVAFVDSDDTVDPEMYETLYNAALEHNLDIIYSSYVKVFDDRPSRYLYEVDGELTICDSIQMLRSHYLQKFPTSACTMLIKKNLFNQISFPEFQYYEDRATTYKLIAACSRAGYINRAFYRYHQRKGSIVFTRTWKHYYDYCLAEGKRLKHLYDSELYSDMEKGEMARLSSAWLVRRLRHLRKHSKTTEQKEGFREMMTYMRYIPENCRLSMKIQIYKRFLTLFSR